MKDWHLVFCTLVPIIAHFALGLFYRKLGSISTGTFLLELCAIVRDCDANHVGCLLLIKFESDVQRLIELFPSESREHVAGVLNPHGMAGALDLLLQTKPTTSSLQTPGC